MADGRQPEDSAPQCSPSGGQEANNPLGANGYSSSFRTCQPGAIMSTGPYSARENGFNGDLTGAHAVTAEQVSARIVQEVTAEAVAVLKGEQESQRLPSVEDTTNLPPSPPPRQPQSTSDHWSKKRPWRLSQLSSRRRRRWKRTVQRLLLMSNSGVGTSRTAPSPSL
uniref:Microtubule-associated protein 2 n=1 Tax=Neogobius melanostomus TaxID=47308 RepID=A0A8C6T2C7_9GOBI